MGNKSIKEIKKAQKSRRLVYENKDLTDVPDVIHDLEDLITLSLSHNLLQSLPSQFSFNSLKSLELTHNNFTEFPEPILGLPKLERLVLSNNQIREIPVEISRMEFLKEILIDKNELTSIPHVVVDMPRIEKVELGCNWIRAVNITEELLPIVSGKPIFGYFDQYVPDFILEKMFLGSARCIENERAMGELKKLGVTHILSIGKEIVNNLENVPDMIKTDFKHQTYSIFDTPNEDILSIIRGMKDFFDEAMAEGGIFVHCVAGISRSAAIVIAYIMMTRRQTLVEVENYVRSKRPCIKPNDGFYNQLRQLEKEIANS